MSDLYRLDDGILEMLAQDEAPPIGNIVRNLMQVGALVPVEIDYEAAVMAFRKLYFQETYKVVRPIERVVAKGIVDAALGLDSPNE